MKSGLILCVAICSLPGLQPLQADDRPDERLNSSNSQERDCDYFLDGWDAKNRFSSKGQVSFTRYHSAPNIAQVTFSKGIATFTAPDKSLICETELKQFNGIFNNRTQFATFPGQYGVYCEVDGEQKLDFDRTNRICRIYTSPKEPLHKLIFPHPLPLIFTRSGIEARDRFQLRRVNSPAGTLVFEGFPKYSYDKKQFKLFRACFDEESFEIVSLVVYPPDFHPIKNPAYDHYEFENEDAAIGHGSTEIASRPIDPNSPPPNWQIVSEGPVDE
jgi:hypothetical protein